MEDIIVKGKTFKGAKIPTPHGTILLIVAAHGLLGCGYFKLETADKLADAFAVVSGVKTYEDMFAAKVQGVSIAAKALGVECGMSGLEALLKMD